MLVDYIPNFEFEKAKYQVKNSSWYDVIYCLENSLNNIEAKHKLIMNKRNVYKSIRNDRLVDDIKLYILETTIEKDPSNLNIKVKFEKFLQATVGTDCERKFYVYAKFLDDNVNSKRASNGSGKKYNDNNSTFRLAVSNYFKSIEIGHTYLWQSLPRILEIWFDTSKNSSRANELIPDKLKHLDSYNIAQVLQILLSRFSHIHCSSVIIELVGKLAAEYPLQSSWWINHFKYFESSGTEAPKTTFMKQAENRKRIGFHQEVMSHVYKLGPDYCKTKVQSKEEFENLFKGNELFFKLILDFANFSVKKGTKKIGVPKQLEKFDFENNSILMPIQENLRPRLPSEKEEDSKTFSTYKEDPVLIKKVLPVCGIMESKEQPKKIGLVGTDDRVYYFLLKRDDAGDLRKEARCIEY